LCSFYLYLLSNTSLPLFKSLLVSSIQNLDQETVVKAQQIVRAFLKRKKFSVVGTYLALPSPSPCNPSICAFLHHVASDIDRFCASLSVASQFLSSPLARELGKRNEIWREILLTEKVYFQSLVMLYETFYKPLKMKSAGSTSSQDHKILTDKQIFKIFQNIEDVKNCAKNMWKKLEETCKNWPETAPKIGLVGVSMVQEIRAVYVPYIRGLQKSMTNLAKMRKTSTQFAEFLDRTGLEHFSGSSETSLPLHGLLMLPLHRMTQYEQYFKELLVLTPPEHVDYPDLVRASREVSSLNFELAPAKTEAFKAQKLTHVNTVLKGPSVPNLLSGKVEGTRIFIREGPVLSVGDRRNKRSYLFLFTDSMVMADINEATEEKNFDFLLPLGGAEIREVHDSQGSLLYSASAGASGGFAQHLFAIIKENKKVVIGCNTLSERASWMNDISTVINELSSGSKRSGSRTLASRPPTSRTISSSSMFAPRSDSMDGASASTATASASSSSSSSSAAAASAAGSAGSIVPQSPRRFLGGAAHALVGSESFMRSFMRQHSTKQLDQFIEVLPSRVKLAKVQPRDYLAKFRGPTDDETEMDKYTSFAGGKVTSTYPIDKERNMRINDPIADHCGLAAWGNRMLGVVADGCGRGFRAQQAASRAVDTFISDFVDPKSVPQDVRELGYDMLRSLGHVHDNIVAGTQVVWDAGTTTLLAAMLVEVEPSSITTNHKWCLVCVNVGDGKAFVWNKTSKTVREVTNRCAPNDLRDPGGRLGPYIYQGAPDLRDLTFSYAFCSEDDFVVLCTDGVYDNFDPELSGMSPKDVSGFVGNSASGSAIAEIRPDQIKSRWDQLDTNTSAELRAACRIRTLEQIIDTGDSTPNARSLMRNIINFCIRQTRSVREFVEQNSTQRVPTDYQHFPGSMDHLTCVAFQVGHVQL